MDAARLLARPLVVRAVSAALLIGLSTVVVLLAVYRPTELDWSPPCLWWSLTGLRCPGCGLTRGLSALLHGEIGRAIWLNPFVVVVPLIFLAIALYCAIALGRGRFPRLGDTPRPVGWALFGLLAAFWIYRTIVDF